jgi:hypothetical protein
MPYKLRKAPKRDLYWVVTTETGKKHSKDPIPLEKAKAQKRILESALTGGIQNPPSEAVMKAVELLRRGLDADLVRDSIVLYLDLENNENEYQVMALAQQYIQNNNGGRRGGMVPVGPPMGIIPAFGPPAGIIPAGGPRHRGPGARGGPMGLWHPGIHLGPGTSTSAHPKAPARTTTGTGKKCCCGKGKYSKVAIDVMEGQMKKKEDVIFQWIKRQAKKGVSLERVAEEMTKRGVPHSVQFDLIRDALKELNAEKSA